MTGRSGEREFAAINLIEGIVFYPLLPDRFGPSV
jgi:hypothetical protein